MCSNSSWDEWTELCFVDFGMSWDSKKLLLEYIPLFTILSMELLYASISSLKKENKNNSSNNWIKKIQIKLFPELCKIKYSS